MKSVFIEASWHYWKGSWESDPMPFYADKWDDLGLQFFTAVPAPSELPEGWTVDIDFRRRHATTLQLIRRDYRDSTKKPVPRWLAIDMFVTLACNLPAGKLFSVVSSNYAHHMSWPLSRLAFRRHRSSGRPAVILNLDNHQDYGGKLSKLHKDFRITKADNGAWGQLHTNYLWSCPAPPAAAYISLGCTVHNPVFAYAEYTSGGTITDVDGTGGMFHNIDYSYGGLKQLIEKRLGGRDWDLYVTIDRDVFSYAKTHFGQSGKASRADADNLIAEITGYAGAVNYVGFDVTGMPPTGEVDEQVLVDVRHFHSFFQKRVS